MGYRTKGAGFKAKRGTEKRSLKIPCKINYLTGAEGDNGRTQDWSGSGEGVAPLFGLVGRGPSPQFAHEPNPAVEDRQNDIPLIGI